MEYYEKDYVYHSLQQEEKDSKDAYEYSTFLRRANSLEAHSEE